MLGSHAASEERKFSTYPAPAIPIVTEPSTITHVPVQPHHQRVKVKNSLYCALTNIHALHCFAVLAERMLSAHCALTTSKTSCRRCHIDGLCWRKARSAVSSFSNYQLLFHSVVLISPFVVGALCVCVCERERVRVSSVLSPPAFSCFLRAFLLSFI